MAIPPELGGGPAVFCNRIHNRLRYCAVIKNMRPVTYKGFDAFGQIVLPKQIAHFRNPILRQKDSREFGKFPHRSFATLDRKMQSPFDRKSGAGKTNRRRRNCRER